MSLQNETFSNEIFDNLLADHSKKAKRILKKDLSTNENTRKRYKFDILSAYNDVIGYAAAFYDKFDDTKEKINAELKAVKDKTIRCCERLEFNVEFPENIIEQLQFEKDYDSSGSVSESSGSTSDREEVTEIVSENSTDNSQVIESNIAKKMSEDDKMMNFMRFASQTLRNFSGEPQSLQAFLNGIKMLKTMSNRKFDDELKTVLLTKIEGKAYECIDAEASIDEIVASLKKNITYKKSKEIVGDMKQLKMRRMSTNDYSKQAEELAEALQRSLIFEGVTREKAIEMTIEETIDMCRKNAKNDKVDSIIASSTYESPKQAISKFVIENSKNENDKQILAYRAHSNKPPQNYQSNGRTFHRNSNNRGGYGRGRGFQRGYRGNSNGFRGRGGYHHKNYKNRNGQYNGQYNVRYAENGSAPTEERGNGNATDGNTSQTASIYTLERVSR